MDTNNEILDAIEILADKKIGDNITKVLTGICTSVNINKNTCVMDSNGVSGTVYFYGSPPEVNGLYRIFVPSNDMSRSFIIVPPKFTVNPNLLDNWYFGNPVNQRGKTSYTANEYSIDRWYNQGDIFSVGEGFVQLDSISPACVWRQYIPPDLHQALTGRTVTFSVLAEGDLPNWAITDTSGFVATHKDVSFVGNLASFTFIVSEYTQLGGLGVFCNAAGKTLRIIAAKLELGSTQTLAHLENGNWVLNEIPKYEDVLSNCQRYAFNVVNSDDNYEILGGGFATSTSQFFCFIPTPVTLRGKPTVKYSGSFRAVRNTSAGAGIVINAMVVDHASNNGVSVICTNANSFEVGEFYTLWCVPGEGTNSLIFSADL